MATEYLALTVLNERRHVSYRNLSRALKVHSNVAKQMLFDFHNKQNTKKPGCVTATYLLTGIKGDGQPLSQNEDIPMESRPPFPSSSFPQPNDEPPKTLPQKSMIIVREEHLDRAKDQFETITGLQIYSLSPSRVTDIVSLAECNRRVVTDYASEDPLKAWKQYGTIQNPAVKRRSGKRPVTRAPKPEAAKAKAAQTAASKSSKAEANTAEAPAKPSVKNAGNEQSNSMSTKPAAPKRQESGIFKAFAKGAAKPKKADPPAPPKQEPEDVPMTGFSDDDMDDDDAGSGIPDVEEFKEATGKSKKDRQADLEAMMDQEDEPMEDVQEAKKDDEGAIDLTESQEKEEPKETVTVENGRRRGRRRVMKKKTVKDEEGYLVTREEAAWESFSEEEPAPKKAKVQVSASNKAAAKKAGGKPGQGNIMSFFSKK